LNEIEGGSTVYTDGLPAYDTLHAQNYIHTTVNHIEEYVRGQVHTQGIENFWSLLKRGLRGTYVAVEPFHLDRYVSEQVFRFNNRATKDNPLNDADRFHLTMSQVAGKRLTYVKLTGKGLDLLAPLVNGRDVASAEPNPCWLWALYALAFQAFSAYLLGRERAPSWCARNSRVLLGLHGIRVS
jgi:hypothetical protein